MKDHIRSILRPLCSVSGHNVHKTIIGYPYLSLVCPNKKPRRMVIGQNIQISSVHSMPAAKDDDQNEPSAS